MTLAAPDPALDAAPHPAPSAQVTVLQVQFGFIFFLLLNFAVKCWNHSEEEDASEKKSGSPSEKKSGSVWIWRNLFISWFHALLVGSWVMYCLTMYPDMLYDVDYSNYVIHAGVCFSTGYFIYDFLDIIMNKKAGQMWEVLFHHVLVLTIFLDNISTNTNLSYTVVALAVEINSIFLHARKLMQLQKVSYDASIYLITKWLNLATFVLARFVPLVMIWGAIYVFWERMSILYRCLITITMALMPIINGVLFWRLIKSDVLRIKRTARKQDNKFEECLSIRNGTNNNNNINNINNNKSE